MSSRPSLFLSICIFLLLLGSASCELINPEEQIPSFLCIDSIAIAPGQHQGTEMHDIVDAWVFENEQLVGVYELPAMVPVLSSGPTDIRIRPGVKLNGQAASRWKLEFLEDYVATVDLYPDSIVCVNPTLPFRSNVVIPWEEDFETASLITLTSTSVSQENVTIVTGEEAFEGKSAKLFLPAGEDIFECKSTSGYALPDAGAAVILEFSYRCNHPFVVSLISSNSGGSVQTPILLISASDQWKHIYVSLTQTVSNIFTATEHTPVFGFVRSEEADGDIAIYLDDIRLMHFAF